MAFAMDTLGYAKRLRHAGIPTGQAEAHAEAVREFAMIEVVTKSDLATAVASFREEMAGVRRDFRAALDIMALQLTVRLGAMLGVAVAAQAAVIELWPAA
ncbi:MAG: hypothetical protein EXR07_16705 [Acetobacteraceae bacterium]|nr:hypothetical protein [Acetobacteraceae bacterium]